MLDAYTRLEVYVKFYEKQIGRELEDDDYLFPFISSNGLINSKKAMDSSVFLKIFHDFMFSAGVKKVYSTHSFRRGGAQYRFMFCSVDKRWSLYIIRWWGGWAEGESVRENLFSMFSH